MTTLSAHTSATVRSRVELGERGFTLIELLVVIAVVGILLSLLLPTIAGARDRGRQTKCASNLRQVGIGVLAYSASNRDVYCSGPFDNRRGNSYGPITETGWLADMISGDYLVPGHHLCPSNPARYTQNMALDRLNERAWAPVSLEERDELLSRGFNTNYTLSWYMGATAIRPEYADNAFVNPRKMDVVLGPLRDASITGTTISRVPLMADARTKGDTGEFEDFGEGPVRVTKAFTDGPLYYLAGSVWGRQDYADFGPAHMRRPGLFNHSGHDNTVGNVLFADGHVSSAKDKNGDGTFGWADPFDPADDTYPDIEETVFGGNLLTGGFGTAGSTDRPR